MKQPHQSYTNRLGFCCWFHLERFRRLKLDNPFRNLTEIFQNGLFWRLFSDLVDLAHLYLRFGLFPRVGTFSDLNLSLWFDAFGVFLISFVIINGRKIFGLLTDSELRCDYYFVGYHILKVVRRLQNSTD